MDENKSSEQLSSDCISLSKTNITALPWEVVQNIFCLLDVKSLIMCKRVCKLWKDHADYLQKKAGYWYNNCNEDIPIDAYFHLLDNIYPYHWNNQHVDWQVVYGSWYFWDTLPADPPSVENFITGLKGISTIKVSGEWLLMSTCEGRGKLTAKNFHKNYVIDIYVGTGAVLLFELVKSDKTCISNLRPSGELENFFNTLDHNEIWMELKDCYIQLGKTYCNALDKVRQKIRHSYGYEIKLVTEDYHSVLYLNKMCSSVSGPDVMEVELDREYSDFVDVWYNKITLHQTQSRVDTFTVNLKNQEVFYKFILNTGGTQEGAMRIYSSQGSLIICYSNRQKFIYKTEEEHFHRNSSPRDRYITAVLYYSTYLFLGTDKGHLLIYDKCDSAIEWIMSNLGSENGPCFRCNIHVVNAKILHIAVVEPSHHSGKKPIIMCATASDVFSISFPKL